MILRLLVLFLTVLVLAYFGLVMSAFFERGWWWTWPIALVAVFGAGYLVSSPSERDDFHAVWRWLRRRPSGREPPRP